MKSKILINEPQVPLKESVLRAMLHEQFERNRRLHQLLDELLDERDRLRKALKKKPG